MDKRIKITGISGSLRDNSSNTNILKQLGTLINGPVEFSIYAGIGTLPHFSPELDGDQAPAAVVAFREQLKTSDGIIICTPEYAFGVPGTLKNALDWTVSSGELVSKPLALITASLSGEKAHISLSDTLTALSVDITKERSLLISFIRSKMDSGGRLNDPEILQSLQVLMTSLLTACRENILKQ